MILGLLLGGVVALFVGGPLLVLLLLPIAAVASIDGAGAGIAAFFIWLLVYSSWKVGWWLHRDNQKSKEMQRHLGMIK